MSKVNEATNLISSGFLREPSQDVKNRALLFAVLEKRQELIELSKGASEIDWLFDFLILGRIVMNGISGWTCMFPPLRESPRDPALMRMQMEVPSSLEKPQ